MSSIIRISRLLGGSVLALAAWAVLSIAAALTGAFSTVTVFGPQQALVTAVGSSDIRIMQMGDRFAVLSGGGRPFVWDLYREGAWLVLPGDVSGCLSLVRSAGTR
jgi:hypothetical protein